MTNQSLTEEMQKNILTASHWYIERESRWAAAVPTASIPERRFNEFYRQPRGEPPGLSLTDSEIFTTGTFFERYIAPNVYAISDFAYPRAIMHLTSSHGMPVIGQQSESCFKQTARRMAQVVYQGSAGVEVANTFGASMRGVDVGLRGIYNIASPAGRNTSTYNAVKWDAAFGPQNTLRDMADELEVDGLDAPWAAILANGLQNGMWYTITNTAETNWTGVHQIVSGTPSGPGASTGATIIFEDHGVDQGVAAVGGVAHIPNFVHPLPAPASATHVAILVKPSASHFQALIGVPPAIDIGPMSTHGRTVPGKSVAQIGIIIPQPSAITTHGQVALA